MAGSLPGVESARRRRFHQSNGSHHELSLSGSNRRSSFCLYASGHDYHLNATSSMMRNPASQKAIMSDESGMGVVAREAKKRLDERLWRSDTKRTTTSGQESSRSLVERPTIQHDLQTETPRTLKKSGSKRLDWLKKSWKWSEQDECAVCLEQFKSTQKDALMQLPCGHKFHANCLVPWLEGNSQCPCCRMQISS